MVVIYIYIYLYIDTCAYDGVYTYRFPHVLLIFSTKSHLIAGGRRLLLTKHRTLPSLGGQVDIPTLMG